MWPQKFMFSVLEWQHVERQGHGVALPKITPTTTEIFTHVLRAIRVNTLYRLLVKFKWHWG